MRRSDEASWLLTTGVMPRLVRNCARGRGIQYAAAHRFHHCCLGVLDRPVKPGDDSERVANAPYLSFTGTV
ncbi:hypothetical protein EAS54_08475 [Bradyrhizobium guangzhouense]|nr:hypothetical protein EAS54_08475 [Bradyrhizobium guangzhouense]